MRGNRGRDTGPERLLRKALWVSGVRGYRLNRRVEGIRPDIVISSGRVAVFVHGCFWHRCPHCAGTLPKRNRTFWQRKFAANKARDCRDRRVLQAAGWSVVESWECRIRANPQKEARRVLTHLPGRG